MVTEKTSAPAQTTAVVCAWCGAEIRGGGEPRSWGMCQTCLRRMAKEHERRAPRHEGRRTHASER